MSSMTGTFFFLFWKIIGKSLFLQRVVWGAQMFPGVHYVWTVFINKGFIFFNSHFDSFESCLFKILIGVTHPNLLSVMPGRAGNLIKHLYQKSGLGFPVIRFDHSLGLVSSGWFSVWDVCTMFIVHVVSENNTNELSEVNGLKHVTDANYAF